VPKWWQSADFKVHRELGMKSTIHRKGMVTLNVSCAFRGLWLGRFWM